VNDRVYFVYGTLRPGGRYWSQIERHIEAYAPGILRGFALYHLPEGYPGIVESADDTIFGDVLFVRDGVEEEVQRILEDIEGCLRTPPLFETAYVEVQQLATRQRTIHALTHIYSPRRQAHLEENGEFVISGDWREFKNTQEDGK